MRCTAAPPAPSPTRVYPRRLLQWLSDNGAAQKNVTLQSVTKEGVEVDMTVAFNELFPGDIALKIPEELVVTLDRIFDGDGPLAELLTTNKLSELAVLTLYLMYEKKRGQESKWFPFIKELDRLGGRGPQGAKSPLLWEEGQAEELLAGSPVIGQIKERLKGIRKEFEELDTVWYMSGSLFSKYPFEVPSEQFTVERFIQAFTAVQSSVVHLQGVPLSKRFALVPLGPPLLSYSSTSKALLKYMRKKRQYNWKLISITLQESNFSLGVVLNLTAVSCSIMGSLMTKIRSIRSPWASLSLPMILCIVRNVLDWLNTIFQPNKRSSYQQRDPTLYPLRSFPISASLLLLQKKSSGRCNLVIIPRLFQRRMRPRFWHSSLGTCSEN